MSKNHSVIDFGEMKKKLKHQGDKLDCSILIKKIGDARLSDTEILKKSFDASNIFKDYRLTLKYEHILYYLSITSGFGTLFILLGLVAVYR